MLAQRPSCDRRSTQPQTQVFAGRVRLRHIGKISVGGARDTDVHVARVHAVVSGRSPILLIGGREDQADDRPPAGRVPG